MSILAVISSISVVALLLFILLAPRRLPFLDSLTVYLSLGMVLGGTVGNLIERLRPDLGGVTDFISVGIWPTFNIADASIVVGVLLLSYHLIYRLKEF
jgi:signal peptidase II